MQNINIALFSPRNKPLLGTIIALTSQPKFHFTLVESADIVNTAVDIAVLNVSDPAGQAQLSLALRAKPSIQVLHLARDESELQPSRDTTTTANRQLFILHKHLMSDLVQSLDRLAVNVPVRVGADADTFSPTQPSGPTPAARAAAARAAVNITMPKSTGLHSAPTPTPMAMLTPQPATNKTQKPVYQAAPPRLRLRALMVDSNPTVHAQLREVIESIGMRCDTAKSDAEAIALVTDNSYNIIYVDATTAQLDGYTLSRSIKRFQNQKAAALILLTSRASPFDAVRGAAIGCDTYLEKPVELKKFYNATVAALSENIDSNEVSTLTRDPTITIRTAAKPTP